MKKPNERSIAQVFGSQLRRTRRMNDISQADLATSVGVRRESIVNYEKGKQVPSLDVADKIADKLGVSLTALILK